MSDVETYEIGETTVGFSGAPVCDELMKFYPDIKKSSSDPALVVDGRTLREFDPQDESAVRGSDEVTLTESAIYIDNTTTPSDTPKGRVKKALGLVGYGVKVEESDDEATNLTIYHAEELFESDNQLLRKLLQLRDRTYVNRRQMLGKKIVYNVLEPVLQRVLLGAGFAFLHASSISYAGRGVVFTGWGGAGKTSISSFLAKNDDDTAFMSDDLAILSSSGTVYPYPKSCVVYPYNLDGHGVTVSDLTRGWMDRAHWEWRSRRYGEKQLRRRVPPSQIYGSHIESSPRPISDVVYLSREDVDAISHEPISPVGLSDRCVPTIFDEFNSFFGSINAAAAADPSVESSFEVADRTEEIYRSCFERAHNTLLRIPYEATPQTLSEYVLDHVLRANPDEKPATKMAGNI